MGQSPSKRRRQSLGSRVHDPKYFVHRAENQHHMDKHEIEDMVDRWQSMVPREGSLSDDIVSSSSENSTASNQRQSNPSNPNNHITTISSKISTWLPPYMNPEVVLYEKNFPHPFDMPAPNSEQYMLPQQSGADYDNPTSTPKYSTTHAGQNGVWIPPYHFQRAEPVAPKTPVKKEPGASASASAGAHENLNRRTTLMLRQKRLEEEFQRLTVEKYMPTAMEAKELAERVASKGASQRNASAGVRAKEIEQAELELAAAELRVQQRFDSPVAWDWKPRESVGLVHDGSPRRTPYGFPDPDANLRSATPA
eukprot:m.81533 g.81533  ORF g.81533 m.81533 type:complete len:309 (-) comp25429_c0_seq1:141-1067(-)